MQIPAKNRILWISKNPDIRARPCQVGIKTQYFRVPDDFLGHTTQFADRCLILINCRYRNTPMWASKVVVPRTKMWRVQLCWCRTTRGRTSAGSMPDRGRRRGRVARIDQQRLEEDNWSENELIFFYSQVFGSFLNYVPFCIYVEIIIYNFIFMLLYFMVYIYFFSSRDLLLFDVLLFDHCTLVMLDLKPR